MLSCAVYETKAYIYYKIAEDKNFHLKLSKNFIL